MVSTWRTVPQRNGHALCRAQPVAQGMQTLGARGTATPCWALGAQCRIRGLVPGAHVTRGAGATVRMPCQN